MSGRLARATCACAPSARVLCGTCPRKVGADDMIAMSTGAVSKREWHYCAPCQAAWRGKHPCPKCGGKGVKRTAYEYTLIVDGKRERKQFPTRAEAQTALDARKEDVQHPQPVENAPKLT